MATWEKIPNDYVVLLHARIKTHGSISEKNVHGWNGSCWYFCHNGVLSIKNKGDLTDSETFFRYLFLPDFCETGIKETNEGIDDMVNSIIGQSKFVFWKNGKMLFYGNFERPDKNKFAYFSNSSYKKKEYSYCSFYGDEVYFNSLSCSLYLGYRGFLLHFCFLVVKGTLTYCLFDLFEKKGSFF